MQNEYQNHRVLKPSGIANKLGLAVFGFLTGIIPNEHQNREAKSFLFLPNFVENAQYS